MTSTVKERDLNPICEDMFHWTAVDKKTSDYILLTKPELVTWKTCTCVV